MIERGQADPRYFVETAGRTFNLLNAVAGFERPATLNDLVQAMGWTKPTVYRLVRTLEVIGALRQHDGGGFVLGPALIPLGHAAQRATDFLVVARPELERLHQSLDETIVLTTLEGREVVYLERLETDKLLIPRTRLGSRLPAHATSTGKVLLAGLSDDEVRRRFDESPVERIGPRGVSSLEELLTRLATVRERGFDINDEELAVGHRSVAAPIRDHGGDVVAAVSVSVPCARVSLEELRAIAIDELVPATEAISRRLGAPGAGELPADVAVEGSAA